jgi:hypothetical protein
VRGQDVGELAGAHDPACAAGAGEAGTERAGVQVTGAEERVPDRYEVARGQDTGQIQPRLCATGDR